MSIILVQFRVTGDPMAAHEARCVQSRLGGVTSLFWELCREVDPKRLLTARRLYSEAPVSLGCMTRKPENGSPTFREFMEGS